MGYANLVAERTKAEIEDPEEDLEAERIMEQFDDLDEEVIQFERLQDNKNITTAENGS